MSVSQDPVLQKGHKNQHYMDKNREASDDLIQLFFCPTLSKQCTIDKQNQVLYKNPLEM